LRIALPIIHVLFRVMGKLTELASFGMIKSEVPPPQDFDEPCDSCRVTGTMVCWGVAAYSFMQRQQLKPSQQGNRTWLAAFGTAWLFAGFARAIIKD
jgi:hypothetical protein